MKSAGGSFVSGLFGIVLPLWLGVGLLVQADEEPVYTIQPGDVLAISVWKEPDLQQDNVVVRPDGGFSFPLVGDVRARSRTVSQLSDVISQRLRKYIPDPVVTVSIRKMMGNRIYVLGRVHHPGEFVANRPLSVVQALAMAGGLTPYADTKAIRVLRGAGSHQQSLPFNYSEVEQGQHLEQNIVLQPGDVVLVP
ncbi:polysaccharide biosynthesis/export family protein [endosymbiont of unidentified scaly snail isolate Monju]|uniref:polysaccharide biosynthesis/export family protein n=1 Tax=endosymbiont of unidentified scaly snail isolate Monju TaxID=1248727 RepID=UPI001E2C3639|nr:polysaccharide biosynthesis/export family protein [endosymbiont of unidentified scaly snail isolate Monju]